MVCGWWPNRSATPSTHWAGAWRSRTAATSSPSAPTRGGSTGATSAQLVRRGRIDVDGTVVALEDVSEPARGQVFAFLMDTATCDAAVSLARDADLIVCESTYLSDEADLAAENLHLTARQAAWIAAEAGGRALVLSHFSQRHADETLFAREAAEVFANVVAARDLTVVTMPARD